MTNNFEILSRTVPAKSVTQKQYWKYLSLLFISFAVGIYGKSKTRKFSQLLADVGKELPSNVKLTADAMKTMRLGLLRVSKRFYNDYISLAFPSKAEKVGEDGKTDDDFIRDELYDGEPDSVKRNPLNTAEPAGLEKNIVQAKNNAGNYRENIEFMQRHYPNYKNKRLVWHNAHGDGACFFTSVFAAMNTQIFDFDHTNKAISEIQPSGSMVVRQGVLDILKTQSYDEVPILHMRDTLETYTDMNYDGADDELIWFLYREYMNQPTTYATGWEVSQMSKYIRRPIVIFKDTKAPSQPTIFDNGHGVHDIDSKDFIVLGYVGNGERRNHYIYALQY
jgi:hypothetical protein